MIDKHTLLCYNARESEVQFVNQELAASILKKYRIASIAVALALVACECIFYVLLLNKLVDAGVLLLFLLPVALSRLWWRYAVKKYVFASLGKDLNAALYLEIVRQANMYGPSALWQLLGEYYSGNFENAVGICRQKLSEPRRFRKYKYYYFSILTGVYFDRGDTEALRGVCGEFRAELAKESRRKAKRIEKKLPVMIFCENFLHGRFDACNAFLAKPQAMPLGKIRGQYLEARVRLCKGECEAAKELFEDVVRKAPHLHYSMLASQGIKVIEKGIAYGDTFEALVPPEKMELPTLNRIQKIAKAMRLISLLVVIAVLAVFLVLFVSLMIEEKREEESLQQYKEEVRALVEEEYDSVEIVEVFDLTVDGEIVDAMFISKTDTAILLGSLYCYEGEDEMHFDVEEEIPYADIREVTYLRWNFPFACTDSAYYAKCCICTDKDDVPDSYSHLSAVAVDGKTVYIVITEVAPY